MSAGVVVRWAEGDVVRVGGIDDLRAARASSACWIDLMRPQDGELSVVAREFGLHPLAVEDCLHFPQRPKIDVYPDSVFLIWLMAHESEDGAIDVRELDAFLGSTYLITVHTDPLEAVDQAAMRIREMLDRGCAWILHSMLDLMTDAVFPLMDVIGDELDALEDEVLEEPSETFQARLYALRRRLLSLKQVVSPERDVVRSLVREEGIIGRDAFHYFSDVADHLSRVGDVLDTYREIAASVMDMYLSAQSSRANAIMKQLTVVATIFMPLTLITGIYGMNFSNMPELQWAWGYPFAMGVMLVVAVVMFLFFRRRDWW